MPTAKENETPTLKSNTLAFKRLKWSVFEPIYKIEVLDFEPGDNPESPREIWRPLFTQDGERVLNAHPIADEMATTPPISQMLVGVSEVNTWDSWGDNGADDERPEPAVISGVNGGSVTIGDFVRGFTAYVNEDAMRELILCEIYGEDFDTETKFWFGGVEEPWVSDREGSENGQGVEYYFQASITIGGDTWEYAANIDFVKEKMFGISPEKGEEFDDMAALDFLAGV